MVFINIHTLAHKLSLRSAFSIVLQNQFSFHYFSIPCLWPFTAISCVHTECLSLLPECRYSEGTHTIFNSLELLHSALGAFEFSIIRSVCLRNPLILQRLYRNFSDLKKNVWVRWLDTCNVWMCDQNDYREIHWMTMVNRERSEIIELIFKKDIFDSIRNIYGENISFSKERKLFEMKIAI